MAKIVRAVMFVNIQIGAVACDLDRDSIPRRPLYPPLGQFLHFPR